MFNHSRKMFVGLTTLVMLIAVIAFAFGPLHVLQTTYAHSSVAQASDFYIPTGSDPWGTAFDASGRVWVAIPSCNPTPTCGAAFPGSLALFDPQTDSWVTSLTLPSGFGQPLFVALDSSGEVWFAMPMTNSIGVYNPAANSFQQWAVPTANSGPWGITVASNGIVWFTEHYGNKIGAFNPATQTFTEIATAAADSLPYGITVDAALNVWFTENNDTVAKIGEYTAKGVLNEYPIRAGSTSGLTPHDITIDSAGNPWWSEGWVNALGTLDVAVAKPGTTLGVKEYTYTVTPGIASHGSGISVAPNGLIWFDDSLQSTYGSFSPASGSFSIYPAPAGPNAHPHDGLHVDAQNRVWFDEEFANKLAVAN